MRKSEERIDHQYVNWGKLEDLLRASLDDIPDAEMIVKKFSEGYSNITYLLSFGEFEVVLRRPPFGAIPPKAHDMQREYSILKKVSHVYPLAPKPYLFSEDQEVMGRHFYVMEKKQGVTIDDCIPKEYGTSKEAGPLISKSVIHAMIELQSINYQEADLSDIGKPEGYLERQVYGWMKRYKQAKTEDYAGLADLEAWFTEKRPKTKETTIVHNDFKLNNLLLHPKAPSMVCGVLDWELSTIGDPMTDLGSTVAYWGQADDPDLGINIITDQPGFLSRREFIEHYANESGRDVSEITYYTAFGFYKLAVILQQIYNRWHRGEIEDPRFKHLNHSVANLFEMAHLTRSHQII
ncbi:phosphotransferase family protein [Alkalihalophilus pseudofirmus]|uniref:phosphotransferase family protein n=1 Tax=Alkalihalophilus pseudofirmus TaxID=79885 RepID=UPI00259B0F14|nr:phosphotransferase family protein [Alkalihalophilus pseudofirmus]WEG15192.1 phosphotransferase family protein [Alkalihalophilus pseudofirmus]